MLPARTFRAACPRGLARSATPTALAVAALRSPTVPRWFNTCAARAHPEQGNTAATAPPDGQEHLSSSSTTTMPAEEAATGYLYFDSLYPIKLGFWDIRHWFVKTNHSALLQRLKDSLPPESQVGHRFTVVGAEERLKDGGAFLSFTFSPLHQPMSVLEGSVTETRDQALQHIEDAVKKGLKRTYTPTEALMLSWGTKPSVHVVRGRPWLEDLNRFPALGLKINLSGGDLSEEQLWAVLRPYGRIATIDKKPGEAMVLFSRMRSATSARNCAHGLTLSNGTRLIINYKGTERAKQAWDWVTNHPRLVLPALAFLLGGFTYAIFDPIREFFIESKLSHTFDFGNYKLYTWLKRNTVDLIMDEDSDGKKKSGVDTVDWFERRAAKESIQSWLRETPETFITISGPRGSGKHKLLEAAIPKDRKVLRIDCAEIARSVGSTASSSSSTGKAAGDSATGGKTDTALISALASEVGYYPLFSWLNWFNSMIDVAAVGLIGSKAGFSKPAEEQLGQILEVTTHALEHVRSKEEKRVAKEKKRREKNPLPKAAPSTAPAAVTATEKNPLLSSPDADSDTRDEVPFAASLPTEASVPADDGLRTKLPIVVIDNFHLKSLRSPLLYSILVQWSSSMISSGTAHVIFVSDNPVASAKEISRALPDSRPANNIVLADAEKDRAREFVRSRLREARGLGGGVDTGAGGVAADGDAPSASGSSTPSSMASLFSTSSPGSAASSPTTAPDAGAIAPTDVLPESDAEWVDKLGGRLTDLETLLQKVSLGQTVPVAVSDLISRTTVELRKSLFGDGSGGGGGTMSTSTADASGSAAPTSPAWTRSAAWSLIKLLSSSPNGELPYHWLLYSDTGPYKGSEAVMRSMEENEIISVKHSSSTGRPSSVRAGRPILLEAMRSLVNEDETFRLTQELLDGRASIAKSEGIIKGLQGEIGSLTEIVTAKTGGKGVLARLESLGKKLETEQSKLAGLEIKVGEMEGQLRSLD